MVTWITDAIFQLKLQIKRACEIGGCQCRGLKAC